MGSLSPFRSVDARDDARDRLQAALFVTQLESRRVLSADGVTSELVVDAGGNADDGQTDTFYIQIDQTLNRVLVTVNGQLATTGSLPDIDSVSIIGSSDDDVISADYRGLPASGLDLLIDAGAGDDAFELRSLDHLQALIATINGDSNGRIDIHGNQGDSAIRFSNLEAIDHRGSVDDFRVRLGEGDQNVIVSAAGEAERSEIRIEAVEAAWAASSEFLVIGFDNPTTRLSLVTGDVQSSGEATSDHDRVILNGFGDTFKAGLLIQGDASDDLLIDADAVLRTTGLQVQTGMITVAGSLSAGSESIVLEAQDAIWVSDSGTIESNASSIELIGGLVDHDGLIVNHSGLVILDSGDSGTTRVRGRIDSSGSEENPVGGTVHVLGMHVGLLDTAFIDVSADRGAGTILIGGGYQGNNPAIRNARRTFIDSDVSLSASTIAAGDGGTIVIWSDETTRYFGSIVATGGRLGGDGGFAEVSGKESLQFAGTADLSSITGDRGTLLLDPKNITIVNSGGDTPVPNGSDTIPFGDDGNDDYSFSPADIVALLGSADLTLQANNDITIVDELDAVTANAGGSLTLQAGRAILVQASVFLEGSFTATTNDTERAGSGNRRDDGEAMFQMSDGVTIDTSAGNGDLSITASVGGNNNDDDSGDIIIETLNAGTGNVTLTNNGNDDSRGIRRASADSLITGDSLSLSITSTATGAVDDSIGSAAEPVLSRVSELTIATVGDGVYISNTGDVDLVSLDSDNGLVDVQSSADATAGDDGTITVTAVDLDNNLTLESIDGSIIIADGAIQAGGGTVILDAADSITIAATNTIATDIATTSTITLVAGTGIGDVTTGAIDLNTSAVAATTAAGNLSLDIDSAVSLYSGVDASGGAVVGISHTGTGDIDLVTTGASLSIDQTISANNGDVTVSGNTVDTSAQITGRRIEIDAGAFQASAGTEIRSSAGGGIELLATSIVVDGGAAGSEVLQSDGGDVTLNASAGDITLGDHVINSNSGTVGVFAATGRIIDGSAGATTQIKTAGLLTLVAATGIGDTGNASLNIDVDTIAAVSSSGGIYLTETDGLTISSGTDETSSLVEGLFAATGGDVVVETLAGDLDVQTRVQSTSGNVAINAVGTVMVSAGGRAQAGGDNTTLEIGGAEVLVASGAVATPSIQNDGSGTIAIDATAGDVEFGIHAIASGSGDVQLTAGLGSIRQTNTTDTGLSTSGTVTLAAANGIGISSVDAIQTSAGELAARTSLSGGIFIVEENDLIVGDGLGSIDGIVTAGDGAISLVSSAATVQVTHTIDSGAGSLSLQGTNLSIEARVDGGAVTVAASDMISLSGAAKILGNDATGAVTLSANDLTLIGGAPANATIQGAGGGTVSIASTTSDIALFHHTVTADGDVAIDAGGDLIAGQSDDTEMITTAGSLTLQAAGQIGSITVGQSIRFAAVNLEATAVTGIHLSETDDVIIGHGLDPSAGLTTTTGDVRLQATGSVTISNGRRVVGGGVGTAIAIEASDITVGAGTTTEATIENGGDGSVSLLTSSGSVSLDQYSIDSGSGTVLIDARSGGISTGFGVAPSEIVTTGSVELIAEAIGAAGSRLDFEGASGLIITDTGAGDMFLGQSAAASGNSTTINVEGSNFGGIDVEFDSGSDNLVILDGHQITQVLHADGRFEYNADVGDIRLGEIQTGTADIVLVTDDGAILDGSGGTVVNLSSDGTVTLSATTGIGTDTESIAVHAQTLAAQTTASGGVYLRSLTDMQIGAGANAVNGILSQNDLVIDSLAAVNVLSGNQLIAGGDDTELTIRSRALSIESGTAGASSLFNTGNGVIIVSATGSVMGMTLGEHAIAADSGTITVDTGTGNIAVAAASTEAEIVSQGGHLSITASEVADPTDRLNLSGAGSLMIHDRGVGDISISEIDSTSIGAVEIMVDDVGFGQISVLYDDAVDTIAIGDDHQINSVTHGNQNRGFRYTAVSGDITLSDNAVNTGSGDLVLVASNGSIGELPGSTAVNLTSSGATTLFASDALGTITSAIETSLDEVAARGVTGGVFLAESDAVTVTSGADAVTGISSDSGSVSLTTGSGVLQIQQLISSSSSDVTVQSGGTFAVTGSGGFQAGGDGTTLLIEATTIDLVAGSAGNETIRNDGSGNVTVRATAGNVVLDDDSLGSDTGSILIAATGGSIIENSGNVNTNRSVNTAGNVTLEATHAIGADGDAAIDLSAAVIMATTTRTTSPSDIHLNIIGGADIQSVSAAGNGDIRLLGDTGTLNINSAINAGTGDVSIIGDIITITNSIDGGDVTIDANSDLNLIASASVQAGGDGTTLSITAPSIDLSAGMLGSETIRNEGSGNVVLEVTAGDLLLFDHSVGSGTGNITLFATAGSILENQSTGVASVSTAGTLTLSAATGIGNSVAAAIEIDVQTVAARSQTSGGIFLNDQNGLTIGSGTNSIAGLTTNNESISVEGGAGSLVINDDVSAGSGSGSGSIDFVSTGIEVTGEIAGGDINLQGGSNVVVRSAGRIESSGTSTTLGIDAVSIEIEAGTLSDATIAHVGAGDIRVRTPFGTVTLADYAISGGNGTITIDTASGSLLENSSTTSAKISSSGLLVLSSDNAIGTAGDFQTDMTLPFDLSVSSLTATRASDLFLRNAGELTLQNVNATGAVEIRSTADLIVNDLDAAGSITLFSEGGNLRVADGSIASPTGNISLTAAAGSILDLDGGTTSSIQTGGVLTLDARDGIGLSGDAIDTSVGVLEARSSSGNIFVRESDDLTLGATGGFTQSLDAGGELSITSVAGILSVDEAIRATGSVSINGATIQFNADVTANGIEVVAGGDAIVSDPARLIAGGTGTALSVDANSINLDAALSGQERLQHTGTGSVELLARASSLTLRDYAVNAGAADILIESQIGSIVSAASAGADSLTSSGTLTVKAAGTIGTLGQRIETDVAGLAAETTSTGGIYVNETGSLTLTSGLGGVTGVRTAGGDIDILAVAGNITVNDDINAGNGDVRLEGVDLSIAANVDGFNISLIAAGDLEIAGGREVVAGGNGSTLAIQAASLDLGGSGLGNGAIQNTGTGAISLTATAGDFILDDGAVNNGAGGVTINATAGSILRAVGSTQANIVTSGSLTMDASTGIGASLATAILTDVGTLQRLSTDSGDIYVQDIGTVRVGNGGGVAVDVQNGGNIGLSAISDLTVVGNSQIIGGNGTSNVRIEAASLTLEGGFLSGENVQNRGNGTIDLITTSGNLSIGEHAVGGALGAIQLDAESRTIEVRNVTSNAEINTAGSLFLTASTIGSASNQLEISGATRLTIDDRGAGQIAIAEVGSQTIAATELIVGDVAFGTIEIDYFDATSLLSISNHQIDQFRHNSGTHSLSYTATSGSLSLGTIESGSGDVSLIANDGAIVEANNNTATNIQTTGIVTLSASDGIGVSSQLDIDAGTLAAESTVTGNVLVRSPGDLQLGSGTHSVSGITAGTGGDVDLDAAGLLTLASGARVVGGGTGTTLSIDANAIVVDGGLLGNEQVFNDGDGTVALTSIGGVILLGNHAIGSIDGTITVDAGTQSIVASAASGNAELRSTGTVNLTAASIGSSTQRLETDGATSLVIEDTGAGDIFVSNLNASTGTDVAITSNGVNFGAFNIAHANGDLIDISDQHSITAVDLGNGNSDFSYTAAAGNVAVGTIQNGSGDVTLAATGGNLIEITSDLSNNVETLGTVTLQASGQIGSGTAAQAFDVDSGVLAAASSGGGALFLRDADGLVVGDGALGLSGLTSNGGAIDVISESGLFQIQRDVNAAGGTVTLNGDQIEVDASVTGISVEITSNDLMRVTAGNQIVASTGITVEGGSILTGDGSSGSATFTSALAHSVQLSTTSGSIVLGGYAIDAGTVVIDAGTNSILGSALDGNQEITAAGSLDLIAGTIGNPVGGLEITGVTQLRINDTAAGDISINEILASSISLTEIAVDGNLLGDIEVNYFAASGTPDRIQIDSSDGINEVSHLTAAREFRYTATAGDIRLSEDAINLASANVSLFATAGAIEIAGGSSDHIETTGTVTLSTETGVGTDADRVNIGAGTLAAEARTSGGIFVTETDGVVIGTGYAGISGLISAGDVALTSGGQVDVSGFVIAGGAGTAIELEASRITMVSGTAGAETIRNSDSGTIALTSASGGILTNENSIGTGDGFVELVADGQHIDAIFSLGQAHVNSTGAVVVRANSAGSSSERLTVTGADSLVITDSGSGEIYLAESGTATIQQVFVNVDFVGAGGIDVAYSNTDQLVISGDHRLDLIDHSVGTREFQYHAAVGTISIGTIRTGSSDIQIWTVDGSIQELASNASTNIETTGNVLFSASTGIGSAAVDGEIDLDVAGLAALTIDGGIYLREIDDVTLTSAFGRVVGLVASLTGDIELSSDSGLVAIDNPILAIDGSVDIDAAAIDVSSRVTGVGVQLDATGNIQVTSGDQVISRGTNTTLSLSGDAVSLGAGSLGSETVRSEGGGTLSIIGASGGITLDNHSIGSDGASIGLNTGTQAVVVNETNASNEINAAGALTIQAASVGALSQLDIQGATSLALVDTGAGEIVINENGTASVDSVDIQVGANGFGGIQIGYVGTDSAVIGTNHLLENIDHGSTGRAFSYAAATGDINVGSIDNEAREVVLVASDGLILDFNNDAAVDIQTDGRLTLQSAGNIGSSGAGLEIQVQSLAAETTTSGGIFLNETDGLLIDGGALGVTGLKTAGDGDIEVTLDSGALHIDKAVSAGAGDVAFTADSIEVNVSFQAGSVLLDGGSSVDIAAGGQIVSTGAGPSGIGIRVTAPTVSIGEGTFGFETLTATGTGPVQVIQSSGNLALNDHVIASSGGGVAITAAGSIDEQNDSSTLNVRTEGQLTLVAGGSIGQSAGVNFGGTGHLDVQATALAASAGSGGVFVGHFGPVNVAGVSTNNGDIELQATETLSVTGPVIAAISGDVVMSAPKIALSDTGDVTANSGEIRLTASASGGLSVASGAVLTTDQGSVSGLFLNASNPLAGSSSVGAALDDTNRIAEIDVAFFDTNASNVEVQIDWGEGDSPSSVVTVPPEDLRARLVESTIASAGLGANFRHQYDSAPDPSNPSADINVLLSITEIAANSIQLFSGGQSLLDLSQFATQTVVVEVSSAIFPIFVQLPEIDRIEVVSAPAPVVASTIDVARTFSVETPQELNNSIGTTQQTSERFYVLRVVTFGRQGEIRLLQDDQEYRLRDMTDADSDAGFELSQLPELFKRLPDDRYRIYLIEGQTERLVLDFVIRDGQPIEATDDDQTEVLTGEEDVEEPEQVDPVEQADPIELLGREPMVSAGAVFLTAEMYRQQSRTKSRSV